MARVRYYLSRSVCFINLVDRNYILVLGGYSRGVAIGGARGLSLYINYNIKCIPNSNIVFPSFK